jgi:uncharacterized YccA/Bax inhibitor family protein
MNEKMFAWIPKESEVMTLDGTINKSFLLVGLTILSALWVWSYSVLVLPLMFPIIIIAFVIGLVIIYNKKLAATLSPVYAILEWLALWVVSSFYELQFPWIVIQAIVLTFSVFVIMLSLYKYKIISVTENFKSGIIAATWAIAVVYLISLIWMLTGLFTVPYIHESWHYGIVFSIFVVGIAALNLILDFDNVEKWVKVWAPKYMEWYTSFWLLVTLIWLYLEILKLLAKSRRR